jgi:hypothetical protein
MSYRALFDFSQYKKGHIFDDSWGEILLHMFEKPCVEKIFEEKQVIKEVIVPKINVEPKVEPKIIPTPVKISVPGKIKK